MPQNILQLNLNERDVDDLQFALATFTIIAAADPKLIFDAVKAMDPHLRDVFVASLSLALGRDAIAAGPEEFTQRFQSVTDRLAKLGRTLGEWEFANTQPKPPGAEQ